MKVLLIGCGAVGISLATALYSSGADTRLVARGRTAASIKENGLKRSGGFGEAAVPPQKVRVYENAGEAGGGYDFIIDSAKTTGNADIAETLKKCAENPLAPGGIFVLCQNGLGNEEAFLDIFHREQIYHASFAIGFRRPRPFESEVTVFSKPMTIGSLFGQPASACQSLADAINGGGIPCGVSDEIGRTLWAKYLYNCALNPLSAILKVNYGGLVKSQSGIDIISRIIEEIFAVMHAAGASTFWPDAEAYKKDFFENILPPTYAHRSSTLQDMERKIPTEINSLNGAIVRMGERLSVKTPYNRFITQLIKAAESVY